MRLVHPHLLPILILSLGPLPHICGQAECRLQRLWSGLPDMLSVRPSSAEAVGRELYPIFATHAKTPLLVCVFCRSTNILELWTALWNKGLGC